MTEPRRASRAKTRTSTSNFGVGRREAHDSAPFYARFSAPELLLSEDVSDPATIAEPFICGDARSMDHVPDNSVALVVTSPPYFAGKQYEEELDREGVPSSYLEYLELLRDVFAECKRKLEPGGRIAVNVANLGRKPYRSLSADVTRILQDELHLLLRGEVIWQKGEGASGSCAWGSFRSAANPVLRDLTERVIIASKGRFDRALSVKQRQLRGLPHENSLTSDEFMAATLDVWEIPPESATRVRHPAPFPTELPERLIHLYTYRGDLVLDPFMGSGSTMLAAARSGRRYVGYDLDPSYVEIARERVRHGASERANRRRERTEEANRYLGAAADQGKAVQAIAEHVLESAGFTIIARNHKLAGLGLSVSLVATDRTGGAWYFDVSGGFTTNRAGMSRTDTLWKCLGRAHVLAANGVAPVVLLTSHLPRAGSAGDAALHAAGRDAFFDAAEILDPAATDRLATYARGGKRPTPLAGFWRPGELGDRLRRTGALRPATAGTARRAAPAKAARARSAPSGRHSA
ncbi:MAG: site-specific DNA-methyltransferase [Actinomycetota bacterium]|nr:site-specific DNA-methyltransferase [Actinomycetota bacterium]